MATDKKAQQDAKQDKLAAVRTSRPKPADEPHVDVVGFACICGIKPDQLAAFVAHTDVDCQQVHPLSVWQDNLQNFYARKI
jgi:hypothetical protein